LLIEQQRYPISTVPEYNFSDVFVGDLALPDGFVNLCLLSMRKFNGRQAVFGKPGDPDVPTFDGASEYDFTVIPLQPLHGDTTVAAVDVSSIRVGETSEGLLLAVRGAVVWKNHRTYRYVRLGPFLFHITEGNRRQIFDLLRRYQQDVPVELVASDFIHLQTRVAAVLERWVQSNLCSTFSNALILFDGSLTAGTSEAPEGVVTRILRTARSRENRILAFSKSSRLHVDGRSLADVALDASPPCLVKVDGPLEGTSGLKLLGNVYVARLSDDAVCFRLDVDKELQQPQVLDALQRLLANDLPNGGYGYPETLRLAHIYSTFTANEVIAMQRYLELERELKISIKPNIRRLLFGPFGKGPEG
jgi:hypothetical protein